MPQTREHFDICRLLGVEHGLVVLTKKDLVDDELLQLARAEAEDLVKGSFLESAPVVAVSSRTGEGIDELKVRLSELGTKAPARSEDFVARLPIDRAFTMKGFGAVVTGTLIAGEINEGDELDLLPAGIRTRVRGVQVHGHPVKHATAGQRTAINLGGVEAGSIERGMVLTPVGRLQTTQVVNASVQLLKDAPRALRSRQRIASRRAARCFVAGACWNQTGKSNPAIEGLPRYVLKRHWWACSAIALFSGHIHRKPLLAAAASSIRLRRNIARAITPRLEALWKISPQESRPSSWPSLFRTRAGTG
jgi:hypothetical protein